MNLLGFALINGEHPPSAQPDLNTPPPTTHTPQATSHLTGTWAASALVRAQHRRPGRPASPTSLWPAFLRARASLAKETQARQELGSKGWAGGEGLGGDVSASLIPSVSGSFLGLNRKTCPLFVRITAWPVPVLGAVSRGRRPGRGLPSPLSPHLPSLSLRTSFWLRLPSWPRPLAPSSQVSSSAQPPSQAFSGPPAL